MDTASEHAREMEESVESFPFEVVNNHLVASIGGTSVLIDTGSPLTIGHDIFELMGRRFAATRVFQGVDMNRLSHSVGTHLDLVLGGDVLGQFHCVTDPRTCTVTFSDVPLPFCGTVVPMSLLAGVPILEFQYHSNAYSAFLDSGAKLSYVSDEVTHGLTSVGTAADFYPGFGEFETGVFAVRLVVQDRTFDVLVGNLPPLLQMALMLGGSSGIIGSDLFCHYPVYLDYSGSRVVVGE